MRKTLLGVATATFLSLVAQPGEAKAQIAPVLITAPVYSNNPFAHAYNPAAYPYGYGPFSFGYPPIGVGWAPYAYVAPSSMVSFAYLPPSAQVSGYPVYYGARFGGYGYGYYGVAPLPTYPLWTK